MLILSDRETADNHVSQLGNLTASLPDALLASAW